jgi:hypothetical protein
MTAEVECRARDQRMMRVMGSGAVSPLAVPDALLRLTDIFG